MSVLKMPVLAFHSLPPAPCPRTPASGPATLFSRVCSRLPTPWPGRTSRSSPNSAPRPVQWSWTPNRALGVRAPNPKGLTVLQALLAHAASHLTAALLLAGPLSPPTWSVLSEPHPPAQPRLLLLPLTPTRCPPANPVAPLQAQLGPKCAWSSRPSQPDAQACPLPRYPLPWWPLGAARLPITLRTRSGLVPHAWRATL